MTTVMSGLTVSIGESIFNEIQSSYGRYYYVIGRSIPWADEFAPPTPLNTEADKKETARRFISGSLISSSDVAFTVRRVNWVSGQVYSPYDDADINLKDKNFYVLTSDYRVYKCLDNNRGAPSTEEPNSLSVDPFETEDGYYWKYIYTITPALYNKFLTQQYMPVTNSILGSFYSRGSISSVIIKNPGINYDSNTVITVIGDGFVEENTYKVTQVTLTNQGSGYTQIPSVSVDTPVANAIAYMPNLSVQSGKFVRHGFNYYKVLQSGVLGVTPPTHFAGITVNGSTQLQYFATQPRLEATVDTTAIGKIIVTNAGKGYSAATVSITNTDSPIILNNSAIVIPSQLNGPFIFRGQVNISNGSVSNVTVLNGGTGYSNFDKVVFSEPFSDYVVYEPGLPVPQGAIVKHLKNYYSVLVGGILDTAPVHTEGLENSGNVTLSHVGRLAEGTIVIGRVNSVDMFGFVNRIKVTNQGSNYTNASVVIQGDALANAIIVDGKVREIIVTSRGEYKVPPTVQIIGDGVDATAVAELQYSYGYSFIPSVIMQEPADVQGDQATVSISTEKSEAELIPVVKNGQIVGVTILNGGVGYTQAKLIVSSPTGQEAVLEAVIGVSDLSALDANNQLLASKFSISSVRVENAGVNYSPSTTLEVVGDGFGAVVEPIIEFNQIVRVKILNPGAGYTTAQIVITDGSGTGAVLRPVISPAYGHGGNPIKELFAENILLYTTLIGETNQGIEVDNEYRQISIVKDPRQFNSNLVTTRKNLSFCYKIRTRTLLPLQPDQILYEELTNSRFLVIKQVEDVLILQSIDNYNLLLGDALIDRDNTDTVFTVQQLTTPEADKYSGHIVYTNNVKQFSVTPNQNISLRTTLAL